MTGAHPSEGFDAVLPVLGSGVRVAGYVLEGQIGSGGMAVVFRARDEQLERMVALKLMAASIAADDEFRQRFIRESRAAAAVEDPHIIPIYAAGEADGVLYIAMRLVAGGDLRSLLSRVGTLAPERAMELLSPVASALDAAHAVGLIHRDVKPANILLDARPGRPDHVYLSDFGLSKGSAAGVSLTQSGFYLGTPEYSAPEQASGGPVDSRADQYALACVAYALLSGAPPFTSNSPVAVLIAHASEPVPPVSALRTDLLPGTNAVLARALAKAPGDRYPSCGEFVEELRRVLSVAPYQPGRRPTPPASPVTEPGIPTTSTVTTSASAPMPEAAGAVAPPAAREATDRSLAHAPVGGGTAFRRSRHRRGTRSLIVLGSAMLVAVAVLVPILASPGAGHPSGSHGTGTQSRASTAPAATPGHSTEATASSQGLAARPFALTAGIRLVDPGSLGIGKVSFAPDGKELVTSDGDVWELGSQTYHSLTSGGNWVGFSPDGSMIAVANGGTAAATVWSAATHQLIGSFPDPDNTYDLEAAISPDSRMLAVVADGGKVYVWDIASHTLVKALAGSGGDLPVAFTQDGTGLIMSDGDRTSVVDIASGSTIATLNGGSSMAISKDGTMLAAADASGGISLYRLSSSGAAAQVAALHEKPGCGGPGGVGSMALTPDNAYLAVATGSTNCVWNISTRQLAATVTDAGGAGAFGVAFSGDGTMMATGDDNGSVYLWNITSD